MQSNIKNKSIYVFEHRSERHLIEIASAATTNAGFWLVDYQLCSNSQAAVLCQDTSQVLIWRILRGHISLYVPVFWRSTWTWEFKLFTSTYHPLETQHIFWSAAIFKHLCVDLINQSPLFNSTRKLRSIHTLIGTDFHHSTPQKRRATHCL